MAGANSSSYYQHPCILTVFNGAKNRAANRPRAPYVLPGKNLENRYFSPRRDGFQCYSGSFNYTPYIDLRQTEAQHIGVRSR
jgi:hypothetical protein